MAHDPDISFPAFVRMVIDALEAAQVEYVIGGSFALWAWGTPRLSADVDIVIVLPDERTDALSAELRKRGMAVPADIMRELVADTRADLPINAIHGFSSLKAEFFPIRKGDIFRKNAFERRRLVDMGPEFGSLYFLSPEDVIIYKIQYYSISRQTKHPRDIQTILETTPIDQDYIEDWIARFGLVEVWREMASGFGRHE